MVQVAAPFDYSWGPSQIQQAIRAAAEAVSAGAGREDTAAFVREFLMSRYEVLYRRHPGQMVCAADGIRSAALPPVVIMVALFAGDVSVRTSYGG